jgi:hypothetical protein
VSTTQTPVTPQTLEQKIETAAAEASQVVSIFSPAAAAAIQGGVAVEPVISGFVQMLIALFKHHTKQAVTPAPVATTSTPSAT